ncbi:5-hydroxytryptamine receptor 1A-like [Anneissia japonica]|uniref:5-hydroxytryptamine receptor 1A-like n=1 Tax=Anneissia japonica TaxID=1529436 RepID=UPI001425B043|nr:5-hydroxytryptamine receptor 1A-like [Anneissia japonica]XP_033105209.1 5-hydroxytryptamine receptor 1A-like [Anneissia japonica]XP_033105210.1 5-hydroxytryptamine receptor 1A-like [Anneissia japonica]XP_033105211.1 5-hydroxytryptamine receptor 1A-like [Anneissia japonica]
MASILYSFNLTDGQEHTNASDIFSDDALAEISMTFAVKVIIFIALTAVMLLIFLGNCLVLLAIYKETILHQPANYLIASLALSDLLVSVLVMPISLMYEMTDEWKLGKTVCNVWISLDVLCCTASILNLCVIALDRYWAITQHVNYIQKRTTKRMVIMIISVWLVAMVISVMSLLGFRSKYNSSNQCTISQNKFYTIFSTFGAFFIPMTVMLFVYWSTFRQAMRHIHGRRQTCLDAVSDCTSTRTFKNDAVDMASPSLVRKLTARKKLRRGLTSKTSLIIQRERRATKTLCIVTGTFLICWLPFFLTALILPFCTSCSLPRAWRSTFLWLGYSNSALNPVIYTKYSKQFQNAFRKILHCK